jgi:hypothetical protein
VSGACAASVDVHNLKPQGLLEWIEIMIPMQERMPALQTKSGNQAIDGLANGIAPVSQLAVVLGGCYSERGTASLKNPKLQELGLDSLERILVWNPL